MSTPAFCNAAPLVTRSPCRAVAISPRRPARRVARATADAPPPPSPSTADAPPPPPPSTADASPPTRALLKCLVCATSLPHAPYPAVDTLPDKCPTCGASLPRRAGYVDLTALSSSTRGPRFALPTTGPFKQALFQLPNVSYAYERGWRDSFTRVGFPGPDAEADLALDFLMPCATLLDMSCGSGLLARRLATLTASQDPAVRVVAADYSDAMLAEAASRARADARVPAIDFVRADVARLPFADAAFDGVHAGAALHCWPKIQDGLRELRRVLVPGGGFFGTTFAKGAYFPRGAERLIIAAEDAGLLVPSYRFFLEDELVFLLQAAGFVDVSVRREGSGCLIVQARNAS